MPVESQLLRRYLLGEAVDAEAEAIEVRSIEDSQMSGQLYLAENDLIEEYLEETLNERERGMFEKHFLISEDRRERMYEIRLLKRFSSGPHQFDLPDE